MIEVENAPAEAARHALPSDLIHEIRTPLNQIIGYSEMLLEQAEGTASDGLVPDLLKVRAAGHRLQAIIEDNLYPITAPSLPERDAIVTAPEPRLAKPTHDSGTLKVGQPNEGRPPIASPIAAQPPQYILVVDDIEANRDVLRRRVESQGYPAAVAKDGNEALEMLAANPFDLVLLDIMMPGMDGFEVLRKLKADDRFRHIPVIMVSALSEMESVARCIEMGADDYLTKPFNPVLLKARVASCLDKKAAHDREMHLLNEVQESYAQLKGLETLRDDLTHMIIHDLRTPLTSVMAGVQTIDVLGDLNAEQREVLAITVMGGETLVGIINDLLDVEKLESGAMALDCSTLFPAPLITSAVRQVASLAESKGLMLLWDTAIDLPPVYGDEHKLRRILVNLLGNAIKFTPSGGSVTVDARLFDDAQSMRFSVRDTGEGVPPEAFARIFEKFGQVDARQGGRTNSTGLGLTFCKLAVEAHGGQIGVDSTSAEGSTFWFTIPMPP